MVEPQSLVLNLNELMEEYTVGEEEVHLEPQTETTPVAEPGTKPCSKRKKKKQKIAKKSSVEKAKEAEDNKAFISDEAYSF